MSDSQGRRTTHRTRRLAVAGVAAAVATATVVTLAGPASAFTPVGPCGSYYATCSPSPSPTTSAPPAPVISSTPASGDSGCVNGPAAAHSALPICGQNGTQPNPHVGIGNEGGLDDGLTNAQNEEAALILIQIFTALIPVDPIAGIAEDVVDKVAAVVAEAATAGISTDVIDPVVDTVSNSIKSGQNTQDVTDAGKAAGQDALDKDGNDPGSDDKPTDDPTIDPSGTDIPTVGASCS